MAEETASPRSTGAVRLRSAIEGGKAAHGIALMSHAVVGYPSIEHNEQSIAALVGAGAELMELQFPFSDPLADGPVLTHANQQAVASGVTLDACFALAHRVCERHLDTAFVIMSYLNVIDRHGMSLFLARAADAGIAGLIVPDLPPEESDEFRASCDEHGLGTIFLVTPLTAPERAAWVGNLSTGFVYCVGRPGVSGDQTAFDADLLAFVTRTRAASASPVGVGFGVRTSADIDRLRPVADMAIVCTEVIRRVDAEGISTTAEYVRSLRP